MRTSSLVLSGALAAGATAQSILGFNSGAFFADGTPKTTEDFIAEFRAAQNLEGAPGDFNAVRLYTNVQRGSVAEPIAAFEAAIETNTRILLGIWASGTDNIDNELAALSTAIEQYGDDFTDLVIGMSVGSEDLYRISETGVTNLSGPGAGPRILVDFINQYRRAVRNTPLADVPVGHVDTWDVWGNSSNRAVIDAVDWIGVDEYPYYQNATGNDISRSGILFDEAYDAVVAVSQGKPVWVTETGWPWTGPDWDEAEATVENAKYFWDEVGCRRLFNRVPTFWYNLRDTNPDNSMMFSITDDLSTTPRFNLTCPTTFETPEGGDDEDEETSTRPGGATTTVASTASTPAPTGSPATTPGSGSGSDSGSGSGSGSDSGSGSGSNTEGGNEDGTNTGDAAGSQTTPPSAASGLMLSTITYASLALVAGAFTFF